jgi:Uncharacterized protein with SCP/PR1 domains
MFRTLVLTLLLTVLVSPTASAISPERIVGCTNDIRREYGLEPLKVSTQLEEAAALKAREMKEDHYFAHAHPDNGLRAWRFFHAAEYFYRFAGENLAQGFRNTDNVCHSWRKSPSHLANIISENYEDIGVAVIEYGSGRGRMEFVVQFFGSAFTASPQSE